MRKQQVYESPIQVPADDRIDGSHILLRPVTFADTADVLRWRNDPAVRDHFVFRAELTKQMHEDWLTGKVQKGFVWQWIICEPGPDGEPDRGVGSVYLRDVDHTAHTAEYGIFIGEADARGKGYAVEAARLVLRFAFETLNLNPVGLRVYAGNERAMRGYLAAGFRKVRTLPAVESTDGKRADMIWMEARPQI